MLIFFGLCKISPPPTRQSELIAPIHRKARAFRCARPLKPGSGSRVGGGRPAFFRKSGQKLCKTLPVYYYYGITMEFFSGYNSQMICRQGFDVENVESVEKCGKLHFVKFFRFTVMFWSCYPYVYPIMGTLFICNKHKKAATFATALYYQ